MPDNYYVMYWNHLSTDNFLLWLLVEYIYVCVVQKNASFAQ